MKINEVKLLTLVVSVFIITTIWVAYFREVIVNNNDNQFLAMGIIGEKNDIENYFVNNNTEITFGLENHWSIAVTNNMNDVKYLDIKVKLLSDQDTLPNSDGFIPSSAIIIYDIPFFLARGETINHEFTWSMGVPTQVIKNDQNFELSTNIFINNSTYPIQLTLPRLSQNTPDNDTSTYSRIVFELWTYNENENIFDFKVETPSEDFCIWNQLFFKINLSDLI